VALALGRDGEGAGVLSAGAGGEPSTYTDQSTGSEERAIEQGVESEDGWLFYATPPLTSATRIAGSALLQADVTVSADRGQLAPTLVDVAPDGSTTAIARGFANLKYRNGLAKAEPLPAGKPIRASVRLSPQDQTVPAGHRIGLVVQSSNIVWALPEQGGYDVTLRHASSRLVLPVVGAAGASQPLPGVPARSTALPPQVAPPFGPRVRVKRRVLTLRARRVKGRIVVAGRAPRGARVRVRVKRAGFKRAKRARTRGRRYRAAFRVPRPGARYRVTVTARTDDGVVRRRAVLRAKRRK
jgi:X-Pro dipeptidyl-peptidase C-terminal non-catalytic domain